MEHTRAVRASKFLSLALRHRPEAAGVTLDEAGWAEVDALLAGAARAGVVLSRAELQGIVADSDKQRFALSADGERIRANQGHSLGVELGLQPAVPPPALFHGTVERFLDSILEQGLRRGQRDHVHLSADLETARRVGARRGRPIILGVDAARLHRDGGTFFRSDNGVWLTDFVPPSCLSIVER